MEKPTLSERLLISDKEVKATAARLRFMAKVKEQGTVDLHIDRIFSEWKELAERSKKGKRMLDLPSTPKRERDLYNLYLYILEQLGLYEEFFRSTLPKEQFQSFRETILKIIGEEERREQ